MRKLIITVLPMVFFSCNRPNPQVQELQSRIDNLQNALDGTYKPGFGEFMSAIQAHHAKLWYAGKNENWKLADFEIHELLEAVEDIGHYQAGRPESKMIGMILPALDSVGNALARKSPSQFERSYTALTNACNNCHRETQFGFNVVRVPESPSFPNQDFSP